MAEENQVQEGQESTEQQEVQFSDVEKQAMEKGWKPKEEYTGDPAKWRSAEVFVALDEPLKRIEHQSKELKAVRAALEAFKEHHSKVKETEYNRALKTLKESRKQAMIEGDTEKALAIEEKVEEVQAERDQIVAESRKPIPETTVNPEFQTWVDKNGWYTANKAMRAFADRIGNEYASEGMSPREVLRKVEEEVKQEFAHKFENNATKRAQTVESSTRANRSSSKDSFELNEMERQIMRKIVSGGGMTEKEYIAELKRVKGA